MKYEDSTVLVEMDGITIKRYGMFGSSRTIRFGDIEAGKALRLGSVGKWRLVGSGPGGGTRNWYGWDNTRRSKEAAYSFDVNRFWRPTVTPDDPEAFLSALPQTVEIADPRP
jgi:hypothetical protein